MAGKGIDFSCSCRTIQGELHGAPARGLHLLCYCDSCRAGAVHAGEALGPGAPIDLYLTQPENITITAGLDQLKPFAFSPNGIVRWQAACCGGQIFSTQANPKTGFMSLCTDKLSVPAAVGPVISSSYIPAGNGKTRHEGKWGLIKLVLGSIRARLNGRARKTPLFDAATGAPIAPVTLISKEEKQSLLARSG